MGRDAGQRIEKTRAEINILHQETDKAEKMDIRSKQLSAKDTSHGLVSNTLVKGSSLEKINIQKNSNRVVGENSIAMNTSKSGVQPDRRYFTVEESVNKENQIKVQQLKRNAAIEMFDAGQDVGQQESDGGENQKGTESAEQNVSLGMPYSSTAPSSPAISSAALYLTPRYTDVSTVSSTSVKKRIKADLGKSSDEKQSKKNNKFFTEKDRSTSCHNGRKLTDDQRMPQYKRCVLSAKYQGKMVSIKCISSCNKMSLGNISPKDNVLNQLVDKSVKRLHVNFRMRNIVGIKEGSNTKTCDDGKQVQVSFIPKGDLENNKPEKDVTSCHDGRKSNIPVSKDVNCQPQSRNSVRQKKKIESKLCASYRALKTTGQTALSVGRKIGEATAAASENVSKFSEEGKEVQAISESGFAVEDAFRKKVIHRAVEKKEKKTKKNYEKKKDTLLEQKAEIRQVITRKRLDGTSLSTEEVAILEKKLGIANKKDKGIHNVSDKRNQQLKKMQKAKSKKILQIEKKLKNVPKKANKELRKKDISAQMRFQLKNHIVRSLTDPNNDTDGTGLGSLLLSFAKTGGFNLLQKVLKTISSALFKIITPVLPALLLVILVPILFMFLIGGIAGGSEEENQAQAQETFSESDYYLSSLTILYGHANKTITSNAKIMKWKTTVKKELKRQGIDDSWTDMVLCMMWQESKGMGNDIMQSGGATPEDSIRAAISVLKSALEKCAQYQSTDIKLVLYCYNYGPGFADYIYKEWDGVCSEKAAQARTNAMLAAHPEWSAYGDPKYAQHVLQNYVFEENPDLKPDSTKWCQEDKNNVKKCTLTSVTSYACKFIGNKYVWGGTSLTNGCDCSGFTQQIYKHFGINIPRTSGEQSRSGKKIKSLSEAKPGDLLFYGDAGQVSHVAMYLGNNIIVHASNSKPYPGGGIKTTTPANYRPIIAIRRYSK